ncbi:MAG: endonuclease V [Nanoarchaeota archaeon]|nr:endonuclease V [Nanoarchaeota archaeon]
MDEIKQNKKEEISEKEKEPIFSEEKLGLASADIASVNAEKSSEIKEIPRRINFDKLREIQRKIAQDVVLKDKIKKDKIKTIAGFDISYEQDNAICAAVVLDMNSMEIIDKAYCEMKAPMPYVPTFLAFRDGPVILKTYEMLKIKPDVLMVEGHGILHPLKAGLACYISVSLKIPVIGVAKKLLSGYIKENKIYIGDIARGEIVRTKEHAKPLFISSGGHITTNVALDIVQKCIRLPHKMPEPLHVAQKLSKARRDEIRQKNKKE